MFFNETDPVHTSSHSGGSRDFEKEGCSMLAIGSSGLKMPK